MKDRSYHESAILYNEGLAITAEAQTDRVEHPIVKKWNIAVGKQHRFHEKRHRAALEKLIAREESAASDDASNTVAEATDGTGV